MGRFWISTAFGLELLLCGPVTAPALATGVADFNIRTICAPEHRAGSDTVDRASYRGCLSDEAAARRTLIRRWQRFGEATRQTCQTESQIGGVPSYVAMLTCLQLRSDTLPVNPPGQR